MKLIYDYIDQFGNKQFKDEKYVFYYGNSVELDINNFVYVNLETGESNSILANIADVIWRLKGYDDSSQLSENSFLRKYLVTEEQKTILFNDICKDFNDENSEQYKEYKESLGLDTLVNKIGPLYQYPRTVFRNTPANVYNSACPLSRDKFKALSDELEKDENYMKLDNEEDKKKYTKDIINAYNNSFLDQINQVFFSLQNNFFLTESYRYVIHMNHPTYTHLPIGKNELKHVTNVFSHLNPFPLLLDTIQFLFIEDKISIRLNFCDFDLGNMFDVLYGITLLLIASHISKLPVGKVYISSPLYHIKKHHFDYFKTFKSDQLPTYKMSLKLDSDFEDFTDLKEKNIIVEKV